MSNTITATIYSFQANPDFTGPSGVQMGFPVENIVIRDLPTPITFQGVDCYSTIEVISEGEPFPTYFAVETATQLISDANLTPTTPITGSVTVINGSGASAVNIQDGGNTITVDGAVTANAGTGDFTVVQPTASNLNANVTGSVSVSNLPATQPISGTVAATQSGSWSVDVNNGGGASAVNIQDGGNSITIDGSVSVSNFPATQPVSGTVSANLNAGTNYVGKVRLTDGTTDAEVVPLTGFNAQAVAIVDGSGNQVTSFGGGTQYADGTAVATPTGTVSLGFDGSNVQAISTTAAGLVNVADGGGSITVDGSVSVSNFPATQAISGTVTANAGTGTFNVAGTVTADAGAGNFTVVQSTAANLNATVTGTVIADTELPTAATLTDTNANPTTPIVGSAVLGYNATIWERIKTAAAVDGNGAISYTGILATKNTPKRVDPASLGTAISSTSAVDVDGNSSTTVSISTTTTGTFIIEGTGDNTNWFNVEAFDIVSDLWVTGQSLTPTVGKVYGILCAGLRQVRIRTNATLGATVTHYWVLDDSQDFIAGIDTGAAPHNFGYLNVHKDGEYATAQTGTALWTPASGKKFVVTDITITTGGTTSGIVTLWQGAVADTTYTAGTDPAIFRGEFAPSANSKPGVIKSFNVPYVSTTADHILRVTTSAAMTVYVQCNGYEI